jgi:hypothetical protein
MEWQTEKRCPVGTGWLVLWSMALLVIVPVAHADTLFNNLTEPGLGQGVITSNYYKAQKFTTDQSNYTLSSVTVRLRANTQGELFVKIYDDNNNLPKQAVGALNVPIIGSTYANYELTPSGVVSLAPNTTYWVVVGVTSGTGYYDWNYTASNSGSGVGFSTRWGSTTNAGATWTAFDDEPFMMQVSASQTDPIPTLTEWGMILFCLLIAGSAYFMIRRRDSASGIQG